MSKEQENLLQCCYAVLCYGSIVGIYASQEDAAQVQREQINRNRPADILCRPIIYSLKP